MLSLLELDEVLAGNATHTLTEPIVREVGVPASSPDASGNQSSRGKPDPLLKVGINGHT